MRKMMYKILEKMMTQIFQIKFCIMQQKTCAKKQKTMVEKDKKYPDTTLNNITKNESAADDRVQENSAKVENISTGTSRFSRRPIVVILIIGVIILGSFLLYTHFQLSSQSYKIENFNVLWNESLADLRSGNATLDEYCNNRVHDENLCNQFKNLEYMN